MVAELDRYEGRLAGLAVVEVEFPDREAAERFVPPAWFGDELTGLRGLVERGPGPIGRPAGVTRQGWGAARELR